MDAADPMAWIAIAALLPIAMWLLSGLVRARAVSPELGRKALHIVTGLVVLSFPWSVGRPGPVLGLFVLAAGWLFAVRRLASLRRRFGDVLFAAGRNSWGEIYFVCGSCLTFLTARGDALRFALPMLILISADSAAALVGARAGAHRLSIGSCAKSIEGCAAFFMVALCCSIAGVAMFVPSLSAFEVVAIALQLALVTTVLEACGNHGSDNFLIPVGAAWLLPRLLP